MTLEQIFIESYQAGNIYHGWISAAIAAAGSIVGGLFGSKKKKEESTSTSTVDYKAMADAAIAGGFNPLTAIRNGGTGGFVTTHTKGSSSGGGASIGAGIADAAAQIAPLFGSIGVKNDPIKLKSKTTGAISPLVSAQLRGSTRQAGSVVVAPRQTMRSSPVTSTGMANIEALNNIRLNNGSFIGPRFPKGAGDNGEIEDAMVGWRRSDGSIMYTYNPKFVDGDAAAAAAIADAANRGNDWWNTEVAYPRGYVPDARRSSLPAQSGKVGRYAR